jgi:hypothetical protein
MVETLLRIAKEANNFPKLRHLRDQALNALEGAHLSVVDHIIPVAIVDINQPANGGGSNAIETGRGTRADRDVAQ